MNIKFRTIREMARSMLNSGETKEARREAIIAFFIEDELNQTIEAVPIGGTITKLYSAAQEIVSDYIENSVEADETFYKALKVIELIEDGESQKALEVGLNY